MADINQSAWSESDASNNQAAPNGFPEGMAANAVNDAARATMGAVKRFYNHINAVKTSGGSANTQTLTYDVAPTAYVTGDRFTFIAGFTNTGAATLNVNGLGAKDIRRNNVALTGGEIQVNGAMDVVYDGTRFQIIAAYPFGTYTQGFGAVASGTALSYQVSFSDGGAGNADVRGVINQITASGATNITQVIAQNTQVEVTATGTVATAIGQQAYVRAGLAGVGAVPITTATVFDAHLANEGTGTVTNGYVFNAAAIDLGSGTGPFGGGVAFHASNQGHATRVTARAVGFECEDFTAGAAVTAAFRSRMASGTNKWSFYADDSAYNALRGDTVFGATSAPGKTVDVIGTIRGSKQNSGDSVPLELRNNNVAGANNSVTIDMDPTNNGAGVRVGQIQAYHEGGNAVSLRLLLSDGDAPANTIKFQRGSSGVRFYNYGAGTLTTDASGNITATSDARLKTKKRPFRRGLDAVCAINPITFKWKVKSGLDRSAEYTGFAAQNVRAAIPEAVGINSDGMMTLQDRPMIAALVNAVRELLARIEKLEARHG